MEGVMDYKKAYNELATSERANLRERIAIELLRSGPWDRRIAVDISNWITGGLSIVGDGISLTSMAHPTQKRRGVKPGTKRGPYKKTKAVFALKKFAGKPKKLSWVKLKDDNGQILKLKATKRKYTKKASYWKNVRKAKAKKKSKK